MPKSCRVKTSQSGGYALMESLTSRPQAAVTAHSGLHTVTCYLPCYKKSVKRMDAVDGWIRTSTSVYLDIASSSNQR
ncbi:unnamed protein product [Nezara viridula]|uniref:Uncharacterized protein n=1 Tax=Nezara viridula TaxID=85310 RepID=A0A9P0EA73_NEZVI|nr:unnamed protein product [Nezara viridula]